MLEISSLLDVYTGNTALPLAGNHAPGASRADTETANAGTANGSFAELLAQSAGENSGAAERGRPVIDKNSKLYEQCFELETFLLKTLVKGMRNTVQKTNLIDTGFAGEIYEDMLYDEYTRDLARNAGLGLADTAYLELTGQRGRLMESYA